ncbi:MAG: hypothetical protein ACTSUO_09925 [Candidatus Thorarchaeota archaeon]
MDNLITRSLCILQDGRYNGIKKECRMGNTKVTGLGSVIERVSCNTEPIFETFTLYTIAIISVSVFTDGIHNTLRS